MTDVQVENIDLEERPKQVYGSAVEGQEMDTLSDTGTERGSTDGDLDGAKSSAGVSTTSTDAVGPSTSRPLGKQSLDWWGAFTVQLITMIGAGILFYPYLFSSLGYVIAIIFLFAAASLQGGMLLFFYHTLIKLKSLYPEKKIERLEDVGLILFGSVFNWIYFVIYNSTLAVLAITFLILIGELMTGFVDIGGGAEVANVPVSQFYWSLIFGIPQLAMAFLPDLKALKYVLNAGVVAIGIVVINQVVLCSVAIGDDVPGNPAFTFEGEDVTAARAIAKFPDDGLETWKIVLGSVTTFLYGFGALIVSGQIISDMGENHKDFPKATYAAHFVATFIYLIFGAMGYAAFGTAAPPSFLAPDSLINEEYFTYWSIASACTIVNASVTVPIFLNSLNRGMVHLLPEAKQKVWGWVYGFRVVVVLVVMSITCTPIAWFVDLTGLWPMCTVAIICIIMPALFYWATYEREYAFANNQKEHSSYGVVIKRNPWLFALHSLIVFIAVIGVIWGFWTSLESLIDNIKDDDNAFDPKICATDADCENAQFCTVEKVCQDIIVDPESVPIV